MNASQSRTSECESPCNHAKANMWLSVAIIAVLAVLSPIVVFAANSAGARADKATQSSTTAAEAIASLRTSNAVLEAKLDILQRTLDEVRQDIKGKTK